MRSNQQEMIENQFSNNLGKEKIILLFEN